MKSPVATPIRTEIPRPEYPRPDYERRDWLNLNGQWSFQLKTEGSDDNQQHAGKDEYTSLQAGDARCFDSEITVPFSWVSPLSGIERDVMGVGWFRRSG